MEPIHPDKMVADTKYSMEDPAAASLYKVLNKMGSEKKYIPLYKTVTFKRVAYKLNGVWHYLFHVYGRKRYFTSNDTFYIYVEA